MKKKRSSGGGANWMDTYGDMVTLLLCFFVLLYSMSTISKENWKALVMSFNPKAVQIQTATPEGGDGPSSDADDSGAMEPQEMQKEIDTLIEELYMSLSEYSAQEGIQDSLSVEYDKEAGKVYVTFNQTTFFDGYSAELRAESFPILDHVSEALSRAADAIEEVRIQGHTARDNPDRPNSVRTDRSLSSNRAANVLIYIQPTCGVDPGRMISEGLGEWHPVDTNETSEGRAKNRRVEMIISGRNIVDALGDDDVVSYNTQPST